MPLRQLAKAQWQTYLERVSAALGARRVEIEATGLGLGGAVQAEWIPLLGLSYEPESDLLSVHPGMRGPRSLRVQSARGLPSDLDPGQASACSFYTIGHARVRAARLPWRYCRLHCSFS